MLSIAAFESAVSAAVLPPTGLSKAALHTSK
jgi:hypothetical protein